MRLHRLVRVYACHMPHCWKSHALAQFIYAQDVKDVLFHLKVSKASRPDLVSPHLLKEGADKLITSKCHKNASSVASSKHRVNRNLMPLPKYYNIGSCKEQVVQARPRLECSSLNSDLCRKHIVLSPSRQCCDL